MAGKTLTGRREPDLARLAMWLVVGFLIAFFVLPLSLMLAVSFWERIGGELVASWSLANYTRFFTTSFLRAALVNSIEVTAITTLLSVLLAYPLAYILAFHVPPRWQRILLLLAILPFWTAYVVRSYSWLLVLSEGGVINATLQALGIVDEAVKLAYTRTATVIGFVHFFTMLLTLTIYASLVQINPSYRKAAADLGASGIRIFLRITLPLSMPGVLVGAFLTFVICIGDYVTPQILGGGTELLVPQAIMLQLARAANLPMAAVMSVTLMLVIVAVYLLLARRLRITTL
jgi:spermidine/putrescine transport system permease protein